MPIHPDNADRYPDDWKAISRRRRREAGWRCECTGQCGHHHGRRCHVIDGTEELKTDGSGTYTAVLTVAHLDHTPEHCDESNLLVMCPTCHLRHDNEYHQQARAQNRRRRLEEAGQLRMFPENG